MLMPFPSFNQANHPSKGWHMLEQSRDLNLALKWFDGAHLSTPDCVAQHLGEAHSGSAT